MAQRYDVGDLARITGAFEIDGVASDPTAVAFSFMSPSGQEITYVYGIDAQVVRVAAGSYYVDIDVTEAGLWVWHWNATGTGQAAASGAFLAHAITDLDFSYDPSTTLGQVRLETGDTNSADPLLLDQEVQVYIDRRAGDVLLAAADICDMLATRFAREFDFEIDGQSFKKGSRSGNYAARAKALRNRAGGGLSVATVTKVDGYSEDLSTRDGAAQADRNGRVRRGYSDGDELPA